MLTLEMIQDAQAALRGIARRTPLDPASKIADNLYIKAENLQLTGAFKIRGAYNKIRSLTPGEAAKGVIACKDMTSGEQTTLDFAGTLARVQEGLAERNRGKVIVEK